ncbi:MAG: MarR family transcriptional regulator [Ponticaulis sp.]|nr:MarR family transcriptional regulator [Ponticaulis sp.]|tara:strand:- start:9632 stop:10093 length:462 start_codon:yes stop_codon:yes gene_type:complete
MTNKTSHFRHSVLAAQRSGHRVLAEMLKPHGLTPAWAEVLTVLLEQGPLSIRELSQFLICEADHPSRLISRIEKQGLISRAQNPNDKRAVLLSLTEDGQRAAKQALQAESRLDAWIHQQLSDQEILGLTRSLDRILRNSTEGRSLRMRFENHD